MSGAAPANVTLQDPPLAKLAGFFFNVERQVKANLNKHVFNPTVPNAPAQSDINAVAEICREAFCEAQNNRFYTDPSDSTTEVKALHNRNSDPWMSVADMNKLVLQSFYSTNPSQRFDITDLLDGVRDFKDKWRRSVEPDADRADPTTNAVPGAHERVKRAADFVNALPQLGGNPKQTVKVVDANRNLVDAAYGGNSLCEFVAGTLAPFTARQGQGTQEDDRQQQVESDPMKAFNLVVSAAVKKAPATTGKTVEVAPLAFMSETFNAKTDNVTTRSDIFVEMDPKGKVGP